MTKSHSPTFHRLRSRSIGVLLCATLACSCDDPDHKSSEEGNELARTLLAEIFPFKIPAPSGYSCGLNFDVIENTPTHATFQWNFDAATAKCNYTGKYQVQIGNNLAFRKEIYLDLVSDFENKSIGGQVSIAPGNDQAPLREVDAEFTIVKQGVMRTHIINGLQMFTNEKFSAYFGSQTSIFHFDNGPNITYVYDYQGVVVDKDCNYPVMGRIFITSESLSEPVEIDFGQGVCETQVVVTVNGEKLNQTISDH